MTCDLNWIKDGDYALRTDCGRYRVTKNSHTSGDWQYASLHRGEFLGSEWTAAQAKQRCADHLNLETTGRRK